MGQYLRDQKLENLKIDEAALDALSAVFVARANARNAAVQNVPDQVVPYYILRFDEKGYRFTAFDDVKQHFTDAHKVERVLFVMESGADRQSAGLFGTRFDLKLDAKEANNCWLTVTSDDRQWMEDTFAAVADVLARYRSRASSVVRTQWTAGIIQLLGIFAGFIFSVWAASVIAPKLAMENAFAVTLLFAFLIYSNIWTYLLVQIGRIVDYFCPNIRFIRKDKEGKGNWLLRGAFIGLIVVPTSLWLVRQLFSLAAYVLNTYIVK